MKNQRFFNRRICAVAQIRRFAAEWSIVRKIKDFSIGEFVQRPKFAGLHINNSLWKNCDVHAEALTPCSSIFMSIVSSYLQAVRVIPWHYLRLYAER